LSENVSLTSDSTVSESQHVTYRQETKEKKIEKQKKKALRAAYDADPDGFEEEPSELRSDIDRAEENMVRSPVFFDATQNNH
jgi:hypothetical protein